MKRALKVFGWTLFVALAIGVALVIAAVSASAGMDHAVIRIDGEPMNLAQLDAGHWLVAIGGIAVGLLAVVLVVPLAVLIPLAIVAVVLIGVLLLLAGVAAMLCSPLLLLALAVWSMVRLTRRSETPKKPAIGSATIAG